MSILIEIGRVGAIQIYACGSVWVEREREISIVIEIGRARAIRIYGKLVRLNLRS